MKTNLLSLLSCFALCVPAFAGGGHSHEKKEPGPNGGRVITAVEPHLEFLVTAARTVQITALNAGLKPAGLPPQVISVTAGDRSNPTKLVFQPVAGALVSTNALPEGNDFPVSVGIKPAAGGKTVYERFNLNLAKCPSCKFAEYACICAHSHDDKE